MTRDGGIPARLGFGMHQEPTSESSLTVQK